MKTTDLISKSVLKQMAFQQLSEFGFFTLMSLVYQWCQTYQPEEFHQVGDRSPLENFVYHARVDKRWRYFNDAIRLVRLDLEKKGIKLEITLIPTDERLRCNQGRKPKRYSLPDGVSLTPDGTPVVNDFMMAA